MSRGRKISVLIAEDHAVVRQGFHKLLESDGCCEVVGQAQTGREAVALAAELNPDVILMDIAMPELNGLAATQQILAHNSAARVLILSAYCDDEYVARTAAMGAMGFLEKQTSAEIVFRAVRTIASGKPFYSPAITRRQANRDRRSLGRDGRPQANATKLTARETEVLQLVAEGQANKQVAGLLGISIKTVEKHRQHLMDKLGIHETAGLTRYAITHGIIESGVQVTLI